MTNPKINGLNPVDSTIEEKLHEVEALSRDNNAEVAEAARVWHETAMQLLASGKISKQDGISEACLANGSTIGAAEARLNSERMKKAA